MLFGDQRLGCGDDTLVSGILKNTNLKMFEITINLFNG